MPRIDVAELMQREEPLCDELRAHLRTTPSGIVFVHHPLLITPYMEPMNALLNAQFAAMSEDRDKALAEKHWERYVFRHERPYRINAFVEVAARMTDLEYWEVLGDLYTDSENVFEWRGWLPRLFTSERPGRFQVMNEEERVALAALPDLIHIWRGYDGARHNLRGWSWTLDRPTAVFFARRLAVAGAKPRLASAEVRRDKVVAYFARRGEQEVVANPQDVHIRDSRSCADEIWSRPSTKGE